MDQRQTKRAVLRELADDARKAASEFNYSDSGNRFRRAYLELADEFERRGRRPHNVIDPNQLSLLETP